MLESCSSTGTLNRAIDLHPAYQALHARLETVQAGPMAQMSRATRGRPPTLAERGEGAYRMSRDRRGTPSHGRTREAGNTTPEKQRPISPPSDEGEANEHADAAATTLGVMGTQATPVHQWLRSGRRQSANGKQASQQTFAWDRTRIVGACPFKNGREFLEAMHSDESCINRHIELDAAYNNTRQAARLNRSRPAGNVSARL
nr:unnamed protein product [Spirometra erinaceieuropaei]